MTSQTNTHMTNNWPGHISNMVSRKFQLVHQVLYEISLCSVYSPSLHYYKETGLLLAILSSYTVQGEIRPRVWPPSSEPASKTTSQLRVQCLLKMRWNRRRRKEKPRKKVDYWISIYKLHLFLYVWVLNGSWFWYTFHFECLKLSCFFLVSQVPSSPRKRSVVTGTLSRITLVCPLASAVVCRISSWPVTYV